MDFLINYKYIFLHVYVLVFVFSTNITSSIAFAKRDNKKQISSSLVAEKKQQELIRIYTMLAYSYPKYFFPYTASIRDNKKLAKKIYKFCLDKKIKLSNYTSIYNNIEKNTGKSYDFENLHSIYEDIRQRYKKILDHQLEILGNIKLTQAKVILCW